MAHRKRPSPAQLVVLAAISAAVVIWRRRCPYLFVGWFWFLGMVAPVLGLVKMGGTLAMADRYMYLPGIGLYIAVAWGAARLGQRWPGQRWLLGTGGALAIVVLMVVGAGQTSVWHDDLTMWRHALACRPGNVEAESGLADALCKKGRVDEAIPLFQRAVRHAPDSVPFTNFGMLMAQLGRLDEATALLRRATAIEPKSYRRRSTWGWSFPRGGNWPRRKSICAERLSSIRVGLVPITAWPDCYCSQANPTRPAKSFSRRLRSIPAMRRSATIWQPFY